ncbi:MAG: hypothetical protein Q9221_002482 [Calogaya cf. arnoldii]
MKQVYFDKSPPEAVPVGYPVSQSTTASAPNDTNVNDEHKAPKRPLKLILTVILLLLSVLGIGLGVGLGLGLRRPSRETTIDETTDATTTSPLSDPSPPNDPELPHGIMANTSLNAFVLRNGDRQVYFQENTGAVRRANYSSQVGLWKSSSVQSLGISAAKNNTPLAAHYIETLGDNNGTVYIFFVSSTNDTLICANFNGTSDPRPCPTWLDLPTIAIASDSLQISVAPLTNQYSAFTGLLLVYEGPSKELVVMLRFVNRANDGFWRDETKKFNAALENDGHTGALITNICKAIGIRDTHPTVNVYGMYCFADLDPDTTSDSRILAYFRFEITVSGNLTVVYVTTSLSNTFGGPENFSNTSAELILVPQGSSSEQIPMWFKDPTSKVPVGSLPSPSSPFAYHRLATTYGGALSEVHMYHQASGSVLIEETWNKTSNVWIPKNILIDTSSR